MFKAPKLRGKLDEMMKGKNLEAGRHHGSQGSQPLTLPHNLLPPSQDNALHRDTTTLPSQLPQRKAVTIPWAGCLVSRDGKTGSRDPRR